MAGLAALAAGALTKASTRVAQAGDGGNLVLGTANSATATTQLDRSGTTGNVPTLILTNNNSDGLQSLVAGSLAYGVRGDNSAGFGVVGTSSSGTGVSAGSASGTGVSADSNTGWGVAGYTDATGTPPVGAVYGASTATNSPAYGVYGTATNGRGVYGHSDANSGVYGETNDNGGQQAGVYGVALGTNNAVGVRAYASGNAGMFGQSPTNVSVYGYTDSGTAVMGQCGARGRAAYFQGDVQVSGNFTVLAPGLKNVAIAFPDRSLRQMYCIESPDNWFEDFGGGSLSGGRATVTLDPDFAITVQTDTYRVFLTAEGPSNGLYVSSKSPTGFTVQEQGNGTSAIPFSYRVVAKRKDIAAVRLEKLVVRPVPAAPAPLPAPPTPLPLAPPAITPPNAPSGISATPLTPAPVQPPGLDQRRPR